MNTAENLGLIIAQQKILLNELEQEHKALLGSDLQQDNQRLQKQLDALQAQLTDLGSDLTKLQTENTQLRSTVFDYAYSEKTALVGNAQKKADAYFSSTDREQINRLSKTENMVQARLESLRQTLSLSDAKTQQDWAQQIDQLSEEISQQLAVSLQQRQQTLSQMAQESKQEFEQLKEEPLTPEQLKKASRQNNIEKFLGLNLLNKIGVLLIVIGVFTASRFAYFRLPDTLKGALIFLLGILMLVSGELASRKRPSVVALGIVAGGVAVLYLGLGISFFALKILPMTMALLLCVLITIVAFVLSAKHNSQVIAIFALIGGYLPFYSILGNSTLLVGSMVYFFALHLLVLFLSFNKKWRVVSFFELFLNIISAATVTNLALTMFYENPSFYFYRFLFLLYPLCSFALYTAIPLIHAKQTEKPFQLSDVIFFAVNTLASSIVILQLLYPARLTNLQGMTAIFFALVYFGISKVVQRYFTSEKRITALFLLTALTFVILVVPFQLGTKWISIGWLIEGVLLATYGILQNDKVFKRVGYFTFALCIGAFVIIDSVFYWETFYFTLNYTFITLGSFVILTALMYKNSLINTGQRIFQLASLLNLWVYFIYLIYQELAYTIKFTNYNQRYLLGALAVTITFLMAFIIVRIPRMQSRSIRILAVIQYTAGSLFAFLLNVIRSPFRVHEATTSIMIVGSLILVGLSALCILAVYDLGQIMVVEKVFSPRLIPLMVSAYFLLILTQYLIFHYRLHFSSIIISILYAVMAIVWIFYGFIKQTVFIRRFGLALALASVVKLVLVDLYSLTQGYRIISYFALGISLVGISMIYQYFDRKLEAKEGADNEETPAT